MNFKLFCCSDCKWKMTEFLPSHGCFSSMSRMLGRACFSSRNKKHLYYCDKSPWIAMTTIFKPFFIQITLNGSETFVKYNWVYIVGPWHAAIKRWNNKVFLGTLCIPPSGSRLVALTHEISYKEANGTHYTDSLGSEVHGCFMFFRTFCTIMTGIFLFL